MRIWRSRPDDATRGSPRPRRSLHAVVEQTLAADYSRSATRLAGAMRCIGATWAGQRSRTNEGRKSPLALSRRLLVADVEQELQSRPGARASGTRPRRVPLGDWAISCLARSGRVGRDRFETSSGDWRPSAGSNQHALAAGRRPAACCSWAGASSPRAAGLTRHGASLARPSRAALALAPIPLTPGFLR
jgi:hypothetical protein